jgi:copper chaperone
MSTITLLVGGMTCGGCVAAVTKSIRRVDATAGVQADLASGRVTVLSDGDPRALAAAVEKAGFTAELA